MCSTLRQVLVVQGVMLIMKNLSSKMSYRNSGSSLFREESGTVMLEFVIYFPFLFAIFMAFLISGMLITQRSVLDRAVAQAANEAGAFLSSDMLMVGQTCSFSGEIVTIRANPYARMVGELFNERIFHPFAGETQFNNRVRELVREYAEWGLVRGWADGDLNVQVMHQNHIVARDLTVTANQHVRFPLLPRVLGWNFEASASVRVFRPYMLMNDVQLALDIARLTGILDVRDVRNFVGGDISGHLNRMINRAIPLN